MAGHFIVSLNCGCYFFFFGFRQILVRGNNSNNQHRHYLYLSWVAPSVNNLFSLDAMTKYVDVTKKKQIHEKHIRNILGGISKSLDLMFNLLQMRIKPHK